MAPSLLRLFYRCKEKGFKSRLFVLILMRREGELCFRDWGWGLEKVAVGIEKKNLTGSRRNEKKTEVAILGVAISEPFLRRKEKGFESRVFLALLKLLTESYVF